MANSKLISIREAARRANIPRKVIQSWVDCGMIAAITTDGRTRVEVDGVARLAPVYRELITGKHYDIERDLISAREAAKRLGIDKRTVYRWVRSGKLPAVNVGGLVRLRPADVEKLKQVIVIPKCDIEECRKIVEEMYEEEE